MRYTTRDMDVIRREARVSAEGSRDEVKQMQTTCAGYEGVMYKLEEMHIKKLQYKVFNSLGFQTF